MHLLSLAIERADFDNWAYYMAFLILAVSFYFKVVKPIVQAAKLFIARYNDAGDIPEIRAQVDHLVGTVTEILGTLETVVATLDALTTTTASTHDIVNSRSDDEGDPSIGRRKTNGD